MCVSCVSFSLMFVYNSSDYVPINMFQFITFFSDANLHRLFDLDHLQNSVLHLADGLVLGQSHSALV